MFVLIVLSTFNYMHKNNLYIIYYWSHFRKISLSTVKKKYCAKAGQLSAAGYVEVISDSVSYLL